MQNGIKMFPLNAKQISFNEHFGLRSFEFHCWFQDLLNPSLICCEMLGNFHQRWSLYGDASCFNSRLTIVINDDNG